MALVKISRNYQIIIYVVILILVVIFLFYLFRQAAIMPSEINQTTLTPKQINTIDQSGVNINLGLFDSKKFINLRSEVAPITSFQTGKRNPFQPQ